MIYEANEEKCIREPTININRSTKIFRDINICELPDGHKIYPKINISALSGRHCGPHSSSNRSNPQFA